MKTQLLILTFFTLLSCSKKNDPELKPIDKLPPLTHIGANTAGCLVNGEAFLPTNRSVIPLVCYYINQNDFTLKISNKISNKLFTILISKNDFHFQINTFYQLNTKTTTIASSGEYFINTATSPNVNFYTTTPTVTGELVITHHNYNNATISGTFWFDAINSNGEKVEVREGRFDMEY